MKLIELKNKRAKLVHDARALLDSVEAEGRTLSTEEDARYDAMLSDVNDLAKQIERQESQLELERSIAGQAAQDVETGAAQGDSESERADKLMAAARSWLRTGQVGEVGAEEFRSLQATTDTEGGYLALPEQMVNQLIKFVDDEVFIRRMANVIPVPRAVSLGVPPLDRDWETYFSC